MYSKKKTISYIIQSKLFQKRRQSGKNAILNDFTDYRIRYINSVTHRMQIKSTIDMAFLIISDRSIVKEGGSF